MHKFSQKLFCELSAPELEEAGQLLSSTMLDYDVIEEQKKSVSKQYTDQLKALRGEMRRLSKAIRRKGMDREIECIARFHVPKVGEKTVVRTDTGEVVSVEPMSAEERQENLFRREVDELKDMWGTGPMPDSPPDDVSGKDAAAGQ